MTNSNDAEVIYSQFQSLYIRTSAIVGLMSYTTDTAVAGACEQICSNMAEMEARATDLLNEARDA